MTDNGSVYPNLKKDASQNGGKDTPSVPYSIYKTVSTSLPKKKIIKKSVAKPASIYGSIRHKDSLQGHE